MPPVDPAEITRQLAAHRTVFDTLLRSGPPEWRTWRPGREHWCPLEIICHLLDEEREDFRARLAFVLEDPDRPMPPIDPQGWVEARAYMEQDFERTLDAFLAERDASVAWLRGLLDQEQPPNWEAAYRHPKLGPLTARMFLVNWLAHDLLHLRQIVRRRHQFLEETSGVAMDYAGEW